MLPVSGKPEWIGNRYCYEQNFGYRLDNIRLLICLCCCLKEKTEVKNVGKNIRKVKGKWVQIRCSFQVCLKVSRF